MELAGPRGGLLSVLQSIDVRLSQLALDARVRRSLTLLHRLRRFYACDGSRTNFPAVLEGGEAILAAHAVADGGNDTVTENTEDDVVFCETWWASLRPPRVMPVRAIEVLALTDSEGKGQMEADPGDQERAFSANHLLGRVPRRGMRHKSCGRSRRTPSGCRTIGMRRTEKPKRSNNAVGEHESGMIGPCGRKWSSPHPPPPRKRQRLVVRTFESGSSAPASSSHEILLPVTGMVQFQLYMENGNVGDASSDASTRIVPGAVEWVSPMASQAGEGGMPHAVEGGVGVILQDDPGPALVPTQLEHPSVTDSDVIESFGGEYGEGTRDAEQNAGT